MLAEDYEYELVKGYVRDFPEYVGQTQIPIKPGFKAIFDSDSSSTEKAEGEETENACEFGKVASRMCTKEPTNARKTDNEMAYEEAREI